MENRIPCRRRAATVSGLLLTAGGLSSVSKKLRLVQESPKGTGQEWFGCLPILNW
jgi:hypothetical protein